MTAERHSIRNAIIAGVAATLIASAILSLVGPLAEPLFEWVWKPLASLAISLLSTIWAAVTYRVPTPAWLLAALVGGCIVAVYPRLKRSEGEREPSPRDYVTDMFHGVRWRWEPEASLNAFAMDPHPFCPHDDTHLVAATSRDYRYFGGFQLMCETCREPWGSFEGTVEDQIDRVRRQIDRKLRTGEWREVVDRERAARRRVAAPPTV